jgi:hypothetical protein
MVQVDLDKAERVLLCIMEHVASRSGQDPHLEINLSGSASHVTVHVENLSSQDPAKPWHPGPGRGSLRGRLGSRRLGESRYSLQVCGKVLTQMGGRMEMDDGEFTTMEIHLPRAIS